MKPTSLSKSTIRTRSILLLLLFLLSAGIAYPPAANYLLKGAQSLLGFKDAKTIEKPFVLGLDLQGGTALEYEADVSRVAALDQREALNGVRDVIERRVNSLGVSEPLVQTTQAGDAWRVRVELAGIRDVNQAIKLIGETPILEFKEQNTDKPRDLTDEEKKQLEEKNKEAKKKAETLLAEAKKPSTDFTALVKENTENAELKDLGGDIGFLLKEITTPPQDGSSVTGTVIRPVLDDHDSVYPVFANAATGTLIPTLIERAGWYSIAKVEQVKQEKEVRAKHLLITYAGSAAGSSTSTKEQARQLIDELKKQATTSTFGALVKQYSQEPGAADREGDLGWFKKGDMVKPFEEAVFSLPVNGISDVVETQFGFHLILKTGEQMINNPSVRFLDIKKYQEADIVPPPEEWKTTKLTGRDLQSAKVDFDPRSGAIMVALQFNDTGAELFADITRRNINKPVAIFLDGEPISIPTVQNEIIGGQATISGNFDLESGKLLARRLQAGALPIPIKLIAQQTVGPSLGVDSLQQSLRAGLYGFILVALFMIALYRLPGLVSIVALAMYAALSAAAFKLIPVTMTLSGIAGFILTLGIAVDANVLVFERLKEELKEGKALTQALEDAFRRAWLSIRDGHMTVLISAMVLYWFSSSVIKGFALTLAIGTGLSLFTAVVATRTILRLISRTSIARNGWLFLKKS